jgi:hypothetical protein
MSASKGQQAAARLKGTSVGYELHIRSSAPDRPVAQPALAASLDALQAAGLPETAAVPPPAPSTTTPAPPPPSTAAPTAGPWSVQNGKGRFEARLCFLDGAFRGADFDVPFGGSEEELRRVFACVVETAAALGAVVFDAQLGREVGKGAADDVVARWRQSQDWMVDVAGSYDDSRSLAEFAKPPPIVNRTTKIVLGIVAGFIALYWLIGAIADFLR